jgi:TonB family protein
MRHTITTLLAILFVAGFVCVTVVDTAHAGEFRILQTDQSAHEYLLDQPTGRVLICGGWADGLTEGLTGTILKYGDSSEPRTVATVVITAVDEHESVCGFTAASKGTAITKQLWVHLEVPTATVADFFALATEAFDSRDYRRALYGYEKVVQQEPDNDLAVQRIPVSRSKIEESESRTLSDSERVAEQGRIEDYMEIANSYRTYRQFGRAHAFVDKILRVDSANEQALALRRMMPDTVDYPFDGPSISSRPKPTDAVPPADYLPAIDEVIEVDSDAEIDHLEPPRVASGAYREGGVSVKVLVSRTGSVKDARILKSSCSSAQDQAVLDAAHKSKFKPAMKNGKPVAVWFEYMVEFR